VVHAGISCSRAQDGVGFNPSIGIRVVHAIHTLYSVKGLYSFNPSIGIRVVHALIGDVERTTSWGFQSLNWDKGGSRTIAVRRLIAAWMFQSLNWDKGGSRYIQPGYSLQFATVSIPQLG